MKEWMFEIVYGGAMLICLIYLTFLAWEAW